jgi:FAD/FMN-containing dehydrogenase/Fe-S oxidoreductase
MTKIGLSTIDSGPVQGAIDVAGLRAELVKSVAGEVRFDRLSRAMYSTDASVYQIVPLGVVIPKAEEDVAAMVGVCARFGVPITARGGGTSQAGQAIGPGVVLDSSKYLNRILEINGRERWARVEPGCVLDDLNAQAKPFGLQFAPDISTSNRATIGGMVANNSSGTHSLIHGKTIDHILELRVLLSDGTCITAKPLTEPEVEDCCRRQNLEGACCRVIRRLSREYAAEIERRYPKILRRVGGYNLDLFVPGRSFNLANLLVGSEGTLAITLEAKLRLIELPPARVLLVAHFSDLLQALAATPAVLEHQPAAVEVIDKYVLDSTRLNAEAARLRDFLHGDPAAILIIEFFGRDAKELRPRLDRLETDLRQRGLGYHYHRAEEVAAQGRIWKLRKAALGLSMAEKGDAKALSFVEDTAVAPDHIRDYIREFLDIVAGHGTTAGVYAHASVGCLHVRPIVDLKTEAGVRQFESIAGAVADLVLKYGGALSGEHGDGLVRSPFQEKMFGPVLYQAFRELKRTFDPQGILNPGKIVDAPPLTANLRYGPAYITPEVPTVFDFSSDGGMVRAAELCAGVGECRKSRDGIMCPSYQATREEQHSTRGRANVLRIALTEQMGLHGVIDHRLREVLDLCLECKACKSECPTNVDMARLKAETLYHYYREVGLPWRNRVFGHIARLAAAGASFPGLVNAWFGSRFGRWLHEKLFRMDRRRVPPPLALQSFQEQYIQSKTGHAAARLPTPTADDVLFFVDTFANYYEPEIARRFINLARHLQCCVFPVFPGGRDAVGSRCCGRPMISNGMLDEAVRCARENVRFLYPWAAAGGVIVACEPSCILTIKDDYPALLRAEEQRQAQIVSERCRTFEEWVEERVQARGARPLWPTNVAAKKILIHGHCHQRSLVGMGPAIRLLRQIPGAEVVDLDAGCCGMAGSFGYEKEHYDISRLVGEQKLFPALRLADNATVIVASGFSCRAQIRHFTGREAIHPVEILANP